MDCIGTPRTTVEAAETSLPPQTTTMRPWQGEGAFLLAVLRTTASLTAQNWTRVRIPCTARTKIIPPTIAPFTAAPTSRPDRLGPVAKW